MRIDGLSRRGPEQPTPNRTSAPRQALRRGSQGMDVARCQNLLNVHQTSSPPPLWVDGMFGSKTDAKVRAFQATNRLVVDGIVGPMTKARLEARR